MNVMPTNRNQSHCLWLKKILGADADIIIEATEKKNIQNEAATTRRHVNVNEWQQQASRT